MVTEAEKFRLSRSSDVFPVHVQRPEKQENYWHKFHLESESKGRRTPMSQLADSEAERRISYPVFYFRQSLSQWGGHSTLLSLLIPVFISSRNNHPE